MIKSLKTSLVNETAIEYALISSLIAIATVVSDRLALASERIPEVSSMLK